MQLKRRIISTATAIFVCLAVFLCACGKGADDTTTEPRSVPSPWSEAQVFTLPSEAASVPDGDAGDKDKTEKTDTDTALRRIETARAVYGLFRESRPQIDKEDSIEFEEGLFMYRVTDPNLDTLEKLQAYVSGYFSDEITQKLLSIGVYTQYEDKLYAVDVGMPVSQPDGLSVKVTKQTEKSEQYELTVKADTERTYNYEYSKQADGKWVFTHFECY